MDLDWELPSTMLGLPERTKRRYSRRTGRRVVEHGSFRLRRLSRREGEGGKDNVCCFCRLAHLTHAGIRVTITPAKGSTERIVSSKLATTEDVDDSHIA